MKIQVLQIDSYNHSHWSSQITATTELGEVTIHHADNEDRDVDWGEERVERHEYVYDDVNAFFCAGWVVGHPRRILSILPENEAELIRRAIDEERKATIAAGQKMLQSKIDGTCWMYRPRKHEWVEIPYNSYILNTQGKNVNA